MFGGSAGGGKSDAALMLCIARRQKYPGTAGLIVRRTLAALEGGEGLIPRSKKYLSSIAHWSERKKHWEFPNGSLIVFGYCDHEDDVKKHEGSEYADITFEELQQFTETQYTYLKTRSRISAEPGKPKPPTLIRATGMPKGKGVAWVKRTFIDPAPYGWEGGGQWKVDLGEGLSITRAFIPSRLSDNKYLSSDDDYKKKLMAQDPRVRDALLSGRWDMPEGIYFVGFDPKIHVIAKQVNTNDPRMLSIDYGYSAPYCALWGAIDEKGRVHIYREIYKSGLRDEEQAQLTLHLQRGERVQTAKADPSCWNKRGESGRSVEEVWASCGLYAVKASNERVAGWSRVRSLLETMVDGLPALTISPSCVNLIRELKEAISDEGNMEDVDTDQDDHAIDSLRYMVADYRPQYPQVIPNRPPTPFDIYKYLMLQSRGSGQSLTDSIRQKYVGRGR